MRVFSLLRVVVVGFPLEELLVECSWHFLDTDQHVGLEVVIHCLVISLLSSFVGFFFLTCTPFGPLVCSVELVYFFEVGVVGLPLVELFVVIFFACFRP